MNPRNARIEPYGIRVRDEMDFVAAIRELESQLGSYNSTAAVRGITRDANLQCASGSESKDIIIGIGFPGVARDAAMGGGILLSAVSEAKVLSLRQNAEVLRFAQDDRIRYKSDRAETPGTPSLILGLVFAWFFGG